MGIHTVFTSLLTGGCQVLKRMFIVDLDWARLPAGRTNTATSIETTIHARRLFFMIITSFEYKSPDHLSDGRQKPFSSLNLSLSPNAGGEEGSDAFMFVFPAL